MTWTKRLTSAMLAGFLCAAALTTGALAEDAGIGGYDVTHKPSHSADYVLTEAATYDMKDGAKQDYTKYWNDAQGNIVKAVDYDGNGEQTAWEAYAYDSKNQLAQISEYQGTSLTQTNVYEHDQGGNLTREVATVKESGGNAVYEFIYTYDAHNNIIRKTLNFTEHGQKATYVEKFSYEYDNSGNVTKKTAYTVADGKDHLMFWQTYSYDEQGRVTEVWYHDNGDEESSALSFVEQRFFYSNEGNENCYDYLQNAQSEGTYTMYQYKKLSENTPYTLTYDEMFCDVNATDWFAPAVEYAYTNGLMKGTAPARFEPNGTLTRAQIAQILYSKNGQPQVTGTTPFTDVAQGDWFYNAVCWAYENQVVNGTSETTYEPNAPVTREQLAKMLYAVAGSPEVAEGSLDSFVDASSVSDWAQTAMLWANQNKIINGSKDNGILRLNPQNGATRAEAATMMKSFAAYEANNK